MQNFFETTIVSTYIKYLLSCTPLPIYSTINTDDEMIEEIKAILKSDAPALVDFSIKGRIKGIYRRSCNFRTVCK